MKAIQGVKRFLHRAMTGPFASLLLFALSAGGVWVAFSSPILPAEEKATGEKSETAEVKKDSKSSSKRKPAGLEAAQDCLTDEAAIADFQKRSSDLDEREKAIDARVSEVEAKEKALAEQLKKIEAVRDEIRKIDELRSKEQGQKVGKVVETLETMTPKSVSSMLATMDESLAVEAMNRMTTPKLAKVLNMMEPAKSARLTERLVGLRGKISEAVEAKERTPASASAEGERNSASEKGGE